jgi:hypothetical protein
MWGGCWLVKFMFSFRQLRVLCLQKFAGVRLESCVVWKNALRTVSINKHPHIETLFDFPSGFRFPDEAADPLAAFAILTTSMALGSKMNL